MNFQGAMTAIVTPMHKGKVDFDAFATLIEDQIAASIRALVVVGTTGESATLSVKEHIAVIEHSVKIAKGRLPVVAGAGANSTSEAIELSKHSTDAGAAGLLHVCPYYNRPSQEGLYRHFMAIADDASLPIILYNVPHRTASDLSTDTACRLSTHDNIVAIKDATGDLKRGSELIERTKGKMDILSGDDFTTYGLLAHGGKGVISVISNVYPKLMVELCDLAAKGDLENAHKRHISLMPMTHLLFKEPNPAPTKAALHLLGKIKEDIRLPLIEVSAELKSEIRSQLMADGYLS